MWDVATGKERAGLEADVGVVRMLAFTPDGQTLATGGQDGGVRLSDAANGLERTLLGRHARSVLALAFQPDGRTLVSASPDGTVRFWNAVPDRQGR
jgi:WD40 repeat protein